MKKDYYCPYSILDTDIICEHKYARIAVNNPLLHNHDGYEILLFLHGDAQLFVESETRKLERGDLVIIPPMYSMEIRSWKSSITNESY